MVQKSLIDYVSGLLKKGYNADSIRNVLIKHGYTNKDVDDAISAAYHPTIRHEIHLSAATMFVVIFVFASLIGTVYFFYYSPSKTTKLLDLNLEPVTTSVEPGGNVVFLKELSNLGSSKRYDVVIRQEIIDSKTSKVITQKVETRAIETFGSTTTNMLVPKDTGAGDYILRVIVEYENKKAVATLPVKVRMPKAGMAAINESSESCFDGIKNQNEKEIDCGGVCKLCETQAKDENEKPEQHPIHPPYPASTETLDSIKELAKTNTGSAQQKCNGIEVPDLKDACISSIGEVQKNKNYCAKIINPRIKDLCYSEIAKLLNDNSLCEAISIDSRKDSCYMTFVLDNKDYSVCNKITNSNLRQSCESLRQLSELNSQQNV